MFALPASSEAVGIDVGLHNFASLSNGTTIDNPRFLREEKEALARAQRRLAKVAHGTQQRRKLRKVVA